MGAAFTWLSRPPIFWRTSEGGCCFLAARQLGNMPVVQVNKIVCQKADLTKQQTITNYGELWRWRIRMSKVASVLDRAAAIRKLEATLPKF